MKITKQQLKRIIKEEATKLLEESWQDWATERDWPQGWEDLRRGAFGEEEEEEEDIERARHEAETASMRRGAGRSHRKLPRTSPKAAADEEFRLQQLVDDLVLDVGELAMKDPRFKYHKRAAEYLAGLFD